MDIQHTFSNNIHADKQSGRHADSSSCVDE